MPLTSESESTSRRRSQLSWHHRIEKSVPSNIPTTSSIFEFSRPQDCGGPVPLCVKTFTNLKICIFWLFIMIVIVHFWYHYNVLSSDYISTFLYTCQSVSTLLAFKLWNLNLVIILPGLCPVSLRSVCILYYSSKSQKTVLYG